MPKQLKLKHYEIPLNQMSPDALRLAILQWVDHGGIDGGDEFAASEHARLLTEAAKNGEKLSKD